MSLTPTYIIHAGDGAQTDFAFPFTYLDAGFVKASINGVDTAFTFVDAGTIRFASAPANGARVVVYRETDDDPLVVWAEGAVAVILGANLNKSTKQPIHVALEARDFVQRNSIALADNASTFDAQSKRIKNVATPTQTADAATKGYVDTITANVFTAETNAAASASAASDSADAAAASAAAASASADNAAASVVAAASSYDALLDLSKKYRKNYIVNPGFRFDQAADSGRTTNGYFSDQWQMALSGAGTATATNVASATPGGSPNRGRITNTVQDLTLDAGDYVGFFHPLEGNRVEDLQWGTANAKAIVVRFGVNGPAGTYCVAINNGAYNRSYIREFTISGGEAGTDVIKTVTFPGDTTGTWAKDNTAGMSVWFVLSCGSTLQDVADTWLGSQKIATATMSNFRATANGTTFDLFDVGLYQDPDGLGVAAPFELPHYDDDLRECRRYWYGHGGIAVTNQTGSSVYCTNSSTLPVPMRTTPSISGGSSGVSVSDLHHISLFISLAGFAGYNTGAIYFNARM